MNLSTRILLGLTTGLLLGLVIASTDNPDLLNTGNFIAPIGALWVNGIRMTMIPLLMALLITAIAGEHGGGKVFDLGARTLGLIVIMIFTSSSFAVLFAAPLIGSLDVAADASAALLESTGTSTDHSTELPPFRNWLVSLIPANPIAVAAAGEILPLMIFTGLFALALGQLDYAKRETVLNFFTAIKEAMFVLIHWIMRLAPIGVFALVFPLTLSLGLQAISALGGFLLITCSLVMVLTAGLYLLAWRLGINPVAFARTLVPVQVIGFSTRSSLASLPATVNATAALGVPQQTSSLVLPIAVTLFKFASPLARTSGTYFIAVLYGIELDVQQLVIIALAIGLLSFYSPGIPSGGLLVMTPVYVSLGLPVEGIGILIAVDLVVDMFITVANVTANTVLALLADRFNKVDPFQ